LIMSMVNSLEFPNQEGDKKMSTLLDFLPEYDRRALETDLPHDGIVVEAMEDSDAMKADGSMEADEIGAFAQMALDADAGLDRLVRFSIHMDVFSKETYPKSPHRPTNRFLFSDDDDLDDTSIVYMDKNRGLVIRDDVTFTLTSITEDEVIK